ncbi:sulfite exporter TauE/SafE family protein [Arhodomonas sp. AD133]|uniref:sulfite exporter TauE/SafE family protein n=1 Tax=Arhodomonas sp. AD133 TaxID=3415009 RepID=UPI003EBF0A88
MEYLLIAVAGFAGSFHCIGMCGGIACALGGAPRGGKAGTIVRHLLYNSGRVTTYVFLGALAGTLGMALIQGSAAQPLVVGQRALSIAAGGLMLVMGAQLFGYFRPLHASTLGVGATGLVAGLRRLLAAPGPGAPLALGVANGFLPCPLVYAFLAKAAATAAVGPAALTMLSFGLGTFPAMLLTGGIGRMLAPAWRRRGVRAAGTFLLALGAITIARGLLPLTGGGVH